MRISMLFALPLMLAVPAATAQAPAAVNVQLSSFEFTPRTIVLDHGKTYLLRLHNASNAGHDFAAPTFFSAASITAEDRRWVMEGVVAVPPGQVREVRLTAPAAGSHKLKCTRAFHKMLGMSGKIIVR